MVKLSRRQHKKVLWAIRGLVRRLDPEATVNRTPLWFPDTNLGLDIRTCYPNILAAAIKSRFPSAQVERLEPLPLLGEPWLEVSCYYVDDAKPKGRG